MNSPQVFLSGVVEGFYGRPWSQDTRLAYADYLQEAGLNTYLYAPKSDSTLRKRWQQRWPEAHLHELHQLATAYRNKGLKWGVGLSPMELYRCYGAKERDELRRKVEYLGELGAPLLGVLFDDMPGDIDALASRQAEIVHDICRWIPRVQVLVCPTYYSHDPVLELHFGRKPVDYWPQLGRELPSDVALFWTGNNVCSDAISTQDIREINEQFGRKVILWDNYPVNDGAKRSNFLYTSELSGRSVSLKPLLCGHLCNPMNQGVLSLPALSGLALLYGNSQFDDEVLARLLGPLTWERLSRDRRVFECDGLTGMGQTMRDRLCEEYTGLPGSAAVEVTQWLRGDYAFDPACLTD